MTRRQERVARAAAARPRTPRTPPTPPVILLGPERDDPAAFDAVVEILSRMLDSPPAAGGG